MINHIQHVVTDCGKSLSLVYGFHVSKVFSYFEIQITGEELLDVEDLLGINVLGTYYYRMADRRSEGENEEPTAEEGEILGLPNADRVAELEDRNIELQKELSVCLGRIAQPEE